MKFRYLFLTVVVCLLASCHKADTFTIEGNVQNAKTLYLEELTPEGPLFIDSIKVESDGHYSYTYKMPYPTFYYLHASDRDFVVLRPQYGEKVIVNADGTNFQGTYSVEGSPESELLWDFQDITNAGIDIVMDLGKTDQENRATLGEGTEAYKAAKAQTDSIFFATYMSQRDYAERFIHEHSGKLASLIVLYKLFIDDPNLPLVRSKEDFFLYEEVSEGLSKELPDNPHTINFKHTVDRMRLINESGAQVIDIDLNENE